MGVVTLKWAYLLLALYYYLHATRNIDGNSTGVVCPAGWINGTKYSLPGCYMNVEKTAPFAQAVRRCIDADPRAHLLYLPNLITKDDVKKLGEFAAQFNHPQWFYLGIIGTGTDINHTSYSWYKPTTKGHVMEAIHAGVWEIGYPVGSVGDFSHFCACAFDDGVAFDSRCTRGEAITLICHISDPSEEVTMPINTNVFLQDQYVPSENCSTLWAHHGLLYYSYAGNFQSVQLAEKACHALDPRATLPNYKSSVQWSGLKEYIMDIADTKYNHLDIPLAAKRVANSDAYEMMDGKWLFSDWYPGQPNNRSTTKRCITMNDLDGLMWRNAECTRENIDHPFFVICELNSTEQGNPKYETGSSTISQFRMTSATERSSSAFESTPKSLNPDTVNIYTSSNWPEHSNNVFTVSYDDRNVKIKDQKDYLLWFILPICKTRSINMRFNTGLLDESIWAHEDCSPMSEEQQTTSKLLFIIAETVLIGCLAVTFIFMLIKRCQTYERNLHMWQEVTLLITHALVLVFVQRTDLKVACHIVSIVLQYSYTVLFCLLLIEALQALSINTNILSKGSFFSYTWTVLFAFVLPVLPTGIMANLEYNAYFSTYSCWLNYDLRLCYVTIGIITVLAFFAILLTEEAHMHDLKKLPFTNNEQYYKASINLWTMYIRIPAHLTSWSLTSFTVFYQRFALFPTIVIANVSLGVIIIVTHTFSSVKVQRCFLSLNKMLRNNRKKNIAAIT